MDGFKILGRKLGYPECCIEEFISIPPTWFSTPTDEIKQRIKASNFTGFVPCLHHAKQINNGEIELGSLIENRDENLPEFPNYDL